jgi:hypothetical protein
MSDVSFIDHRGKRILLMDISNQHDPDASIALGRRALEIITIQPPRSLLLLTDVSGARFNAGATAFMKEYSSAISPYVHASVIVGVGGIMKVILQSLVRISGREIHVCDTRQEALDWLVQQ